ncbi:hypothetical protein Droror1_Dr00021617 [Drosera rotundifolia]
MSIIPLLLLTIPPLLFSSSVHDLLISKGLPAGLMPREIKSYTLDETTGHLQVILDGPCLTRFENRVYYESVVRANISYGELVGVMGLSQEELFIWLPVKGIVVNDPRSGLILFDIGVAYKQLSLSLFEDPPSCKNHGIISSYMRRKEQGFGDQR